MSGLPIKPFGNLCSVTLDLPWEVADALAEHGPAVIAAIQEAVRSRKVDAADAEVRRTAVDSQCDQNRADWAALARRCEAEVARRSNGPGQRPAILRQLASELGVKVSFLNTICRVFTREDKQQGLARRKAEIIRLHLIGRTDKQIAQEVKLARETVTRILAAEKEAILALRVTPAELQRLQAAAVGNGGAS